MCRDRTKTEYPELKKKMMRIKTSPLRKDASQDFQVLQNLKNRKKEPLAKLSELVATGS